MDVEETLRKIERIEIQGATDIAIAGIQLLQQLHDDSAEDARINQVVERLRTARPTEPLLVNAIRVAQETNDYDRVLQQIRESRDRIAAQSVDIVPDNGIVYTHCHSSTVTAILKRAAETKDFTVHATETRPLYQGRKTAEELAAAGIPVKLFVDAGGRLALKEADRMLIGADAITAKGKVINKIGSELFAETAERFDVPVHVCSNAWKYDPRSAFGFEEALERRAGEEVWPDPPEHVEVVNYAFERVAPERIHRIHSELGAHTVSGFLAAVKDAYPELT